MTTGQLIRTARKNAGMTQSELAQRLNIPFQSVSQWERDLRNPKYDTLKKIANALCIEVEQLFTDRELEISESSDIDGWLRAIDYYNVQDFRALIKTMKQHKYTLSNTEKNVISAFSQLNDIGQQEAGKRIKELTEIPRYRAETAPESTLNLNEGSSTTPPSDAPETPPEGE